MKKSILLASLFFCSAIAQSQSYIGFLTDNYSGVNSVIANPANISDSPFKTDIHLVGISAFFTNDYYGVKVTDALKEDYDFDLDATKSPSTNNNANINLDVMGPAFMFNLDKKSSIALFTRARTFINVNEINGESIDRIDDDINLTDDFIINEGDFFASGNAWAEFGLTYARVLLNKDQHFLKGGLSIKYLKGLGSVYGVGKNVDINFNADGTALPGGSTTGSYTSTGDITYGRFTDFEDENYEYEAPKNASGLGIDLGFVYELRPDHASYNTTNANGDINLHKDKNKYKLKIGLSITDLGSINYKEGTTDNYDINATVSEDDIDNAEDINALLNDFYSLSSSQGNIKSLLPTAVHLNADLNLNNHFYLNLNTDLSVTSNSKENASRISNVASLTPRFESKFFSFYVPLSLVQHSGFQIGAGFRAGPLYIGSGSLISLFSSEAKGADVFAGLKIPVYQKRKKDNDNDGIPNKKDDCPDHEGPAENNGCPWPDTDGDTVIDKDDNCPEEPGEVENGGCPWPDNDSDGVLDKDDKCPKETGAIENEGCPWLDTDGDSILDKDDKCPEEAGPVANNGCPEIEEIALTEAVQKTLNDYAKTILFTTGKSSIKAESTGVILDIIKILQEYPNARFSIEGHTDSVGSEITNQKLSTKRALAVKNFLVGQGIDTSRLESIGYGEKKPIATNMYKEGRSQNRRVEINLLKE